MAHAAQPAIPSNLPIALTSFIGRERELAQVKELLRQTRLLTLTGTGGCGKTRLALEVARQVVNDYPDGVWLVALAPLADPTLVPQAVATALGVSEQHGQTTTDTLITSLRLRRLLLLLDNCEHLIDACAELVETLLASCPGLTMLATSRERLSVPGETAWRAPSLTVPARQSLPSLDELRAYEAVQLFVARTQQAQPGFAMTPLNAPAVVEVCQRLDGIPLALELAAARVPGLGMRELAARLDDRFRLLTGGRRTGLRRQQTLQAAIDWSHDLLTVPEQTLLRRLAVFAGGWTLAAAEQVCAGDGIERGDVLDLLTHLVDKSLVVAEEREGMVRYRLLETIRQYAGNTLLREGELAALRARHRGWCLALAEQAMPGLWGHEQPQWLDRLETEHDNLRAALDWSHAEPEGAAAELRLAAALAEFWDWRGHHSEGRTRLAAALARDDGSMPATRALALDWLGRLATFAGEFEQATALLEESLALARTVGEPRSIARVLRHLAAMPVSQGRLDDAEALVTEALD